MTWRHGSVGICLAMVCALFVASTTDASANGRGRGNDEACDRAGSQHTFRAQRVVMPAKRVQKKPALQVRVGVEKQKSPWQSLASAMVGTMPPTLIDITASLGEVLLAVNDLESKDAAGPGPAVEVNVTRKSGGYDLTLDTVDEKVNGALSAGAAPPVTPPEKPPFRTFNIGATTNVAIAVNAP